MKVVHSDLHQHKFENDLALAIGNFDGMHHGHQQLIHQCVEGARVTNLVSAALTFRPHPQSVLRPDSAPRLLYSEPQLIRHMSESRIDQLIVAPFDHKLALYSGEKFVDEILKQKMRVKKIFVGENFRFGRNRENGVTELKLWQKRFDFQLHVIPAVEINGQIASSSRIREHVVSGDVESARQILGRPFAILGRVVPGRGAGRNLNFSTANFENPDTVLPKVGVYVTATRLEAGAVFRSVTNIGYAPTVAKDNVTLRVETHLLSESQDLYGQMIEVFFLKWVRAEQKFTSLIALQEQIGKDVERARQHQDSFYEMGRNR